MKLSKLKGKEILSSDGRSVGVLDGAILSGKWKINNVSVKVDKNAVADLGKSKPLLFSLRQDMSVELIKAIDDKIILEQDIRALGPMMHEHNEELSAGRIMGMEVVDTGGNVIGKADDIILNCVAKCTEWEMPTLIVAVDKDAVEDINLKKKLFSTHSLHINMKHVENIGDVIMLALDAKGVTDIIDKTEAKVS